MKKDLKKLTWKDGNIFDKVKSLRDHLKEIQTKIDKDPDNKLLREAESKVLAEYVDSMKDGEKLLFQKSKVKWLSLGDRNNAYFHKVLKSRGHKSRINQINDENGNCFYGKEVAEQFVKHFQGFLGKVVQVKELDSIDYLFKTKLSSEDALFMISEISDEEIKNAMFFIDSNKVPGPDGFSSLFFKKARSIVGKDVCRAVKDFFDNGKIMREINSTIISLVPKILTPNKVTVFRPIASCNVLYKCISKIITERMKIGLRKIVGYERKDGPSRVAMKIDIQKAYDTVNWQFLEVILKGFGFHCKMVNWIIKCVTTTSFSICVNGESFSYFKRGRGLRQADPMSPYLFTLVMEILTLIVEKRVEGSKEFKYHFGCKEMKLTHVCFADDLMMFSHGDKKFVMVLKKVIEEFGSIAGLLPNYNKSTIIFGSMAKEEKQIILSSIPFRVEKLPVKYLGVPLTSKRIGVKNCQLIASVLESIHMYWTSVFLLPQAVINDINNPKSEGGLGLKHLGVWNKAMFAKHLWHLAMNKVSQWVKWVNIVKLKGKSIWTANEEVWDSWGWKNILRLKDEVRQYLVKKVGDGGTTSVIYDNWSNIRVLQSFITQRSI
ncbi:RNA-directed DNA polymerase, eukaryota, reverse transcriptase zinc-binding domain protein [Tanacetum coccineum]|uniref:RNA-directed DNA polymerase, eukaryota, reverse transcriptase zinc-binding domain protein n=1 Tax=Tanacetum coccineum TaxID=301880 RepID=A0ABQ5GKD5_9ASTR